MGSFQRSGKSCSKKPWGSQESILARGFGFGEPELQFVAAHHARLLVLRDGECVYVHTHIHMYIHIHIWYVFIYTYIIVCVYIYAKQQGSLIIMVTFLSYLAATRVVGAPSRMPCARRGPISVNECGIGVTEALVAIFCKCTIPGDSYAVPFLVVYYNPQ